MVAYVKWVAKGLALCAGPFLLWLAWLHGGTESTISLFKTVYVVPKILTVGPRSSDAGRGWIDGGSHSASYSLPPPGQQGDNTWYILDIHIHLRLRKTSRYGSVSEVGVLTNGRMAAAIDVFSGRINGEPAFWWSSGELFSGPSSGLTLDRDLDVHFKNYLQIQGVRPGKNVFTLTLTHFSGGGAIESAALLPRSRVAEGPLGPPRASLERECRYSICSGWNSDRCVISSVESRTFRKKHVARRYHLITATYGGRNAKRIHGVRTGTAWQHLGRGANAGRVSGDIACERYNGRTG